MSQNLSDSDRRNLAKASMQQGNSTQVKSHDAGVPQSRMKHRDADLANLRARAARDGSPSNDFDLNPQDRQSRRRSRSYNNDDVSASVLNRARPVPSEYHLFDDDTLRRSEAQRLALRKSQSYTNTPERAVSHGMSDPSSMMPGSRRGSAIGSAGAGARNASFANAGTGAPNDSNALRVPHSQSFSGSLLRNQIDAGPGKERSRGGFLKRMFTSSSKASLTSADSKQQVPQLPPLETHSKKDDRRSQALQEHQASKNATPAQTESTPPQAQPRPPPLRTKRSFFQRRRKTLAEEEMPDVSSEPPPPAPGHQSNRPSTSSLRQVMNPWIAGPLSPRKREVDQDLDFDHPDELPAPRRTEPRQNAYEFLRSSSPPGSVGRSKPGTQLPPRSDHKVSGSSSPKLHRQRPSTSARESNATSDPNMEVASPAKRAAELSAATKASRRRSATYSPIQSTFADSAEPDRRESTATPPLVKTSTPVKSDAEQPKPVPPRVASKPQVTQDEASKSDLQAPQEAPDNAWSNRTWIQPDDSSDEDTATAPKPAETKVDSPRSPQHIKAVASEVSIAQEDFISARSVADVEIADHDNDPVSPLSNVGDTQPPLSPLPDALPSTDSYEDQARRIFEGQSDPQVREQGSVELGEPGADADRLRTAFMSFFDFAGLNILLALRDLCTRMTLKGETQQMDRIMSAFSRRWCECNASNGFKSPDVVHTICYSLLLLNTDLHVADLTDKMTRNQFVKNTIPTLRRIAEAETDTADATLKPRAESERGSIPFKDDRPLSPTDAETRLSADNRNGASRMSHQPALRPTSGVPPLASPSPYDTHPNDASELLVNSPYEGTMRGWESALETVLKEHYLSIRQLRLPLYGAEEVAQLHEQPSTNSLSVMTNLMRRTGSVISKTASEDSRGRGSAFRSAAGRLASKNRSRPRLYPASTFGSSRTASRTSFEDNHVWSPSASSFTSKTLTTMSTDSLSSKFAPSEMGYQQSIGFANALSHVIIREEGASTLDHDGDVDGSLLDDESLELSGAPWAKEGILQHKHHLESEGKKAKDRNWSECFAVIQRGHMRLFSFNSKSSTRSQRKPVKGAVVGGGNWMENAEALASFTLRHTIANALPPPGYSKQRPHVFCLSLPTGAVHLFHVGTTEIAQEFVMTANYWSARLSKEPLVGGVSSIEYGWGESVINTALLGSVSKSDAASTAANKSNPSQPPSSFHLPRAESSLSVTSPTGRASSSGNRSLHSPSPSASFSLHGGTTGAERSSSTQRPSISGSLRSSFDAPRPAAFRNRLPADRLLLGNWQPAQQSLMPSRLPESEQLTALKAYVSSIEEELGKHNELRHALALAFTPRSVNAGKAMTNWERKSHYLLREIVKFRTYVDVLELGEIRRGEVQAERDLKDMKSEEKKGDVRVVDEGREDDGLSEETLEALRAARPMEVET